MLSKRLALLILVLGLSANAGTGVIYTHDSKGELTANDPAFVASISQVINSVDAFGLADVTANLIVSGASAPSADYGSVIYTPRSYSIDGEYGGVHQKSMMDLLAVFAHEYGHLVFAKILEREIPEYARLKNVGDRISALSLELAQSRDPALQNQLKEKIKAAYDLIYKDERRLKISRIASPYGELFADVIAVYESGEKSVIYDALSYPGMNRIYDDYIAARDFSPARDAKAWTQNEEHVLFSPLRSAIGSAACWPRTEAAKKLRLRQLSGLLVADIARKAASGVEPGLEDNQILIDRFRAYCRQAQ